jgi:uncharacterized protein YdaU (DUF1376 family)
VSDTENKVDAWMPLWIGSYLADTMKLTTIQHGAYLLLLIAYWRERGPLNDDDEELASTVKASPKDWRALRPKLEGFFLVDGGKWRHGRADQELAKALEHKAAAVTKAKAGADARWKKQREAREQAASNACGNAPSIAQGLPGQCPPPSPPPSSLRSDPPAPDPGEGFEAFWEAYPSGPRKAAKAQCLAKWKSRGCSLLTQQIVGHVQAMAKSEQWLKDKGQYVPAPLVYLNQTRWEAGTEADAAAALEAEQWHESVKGIVAKGIELGVGEWSEAIWMSGKQPDWPAYRSRVYRAAGFVPRAAA